MYSLIRMCGFKYMNIGNKSFTWRNFQFNDSVRQNLTGTKSKLGTLLCYQGRPSEVKTAAFTIPTTLNGWKQEAKMKRNEFIDFKM